jgi:hypothetical protein
MSGSAAASSGYRDQDILESVLGPGGHEQLPAASEVGPNRLRRRLERFRGAVIERDGFAGNEDEAELKLQLLLLREENARLKSDRELPASPGTTLDRVRTLATSANESEALDDAFSILAECLALREGLDQVCLEMGEALDGVRGRLVEIADRVELKMTQSKDAAGLSA